MSIRNRIQHLIDQLRFAYEVGRARAENSPQPRISKWAEERAEEKRRAMIEEPQREIIKYMAESLEGGEQDTITKSSKELVEESNEWLSRKTNNCEGDVDV